MKKSAWAFVGVLISTTAYCQPSINLVADTAHAPFIYGVASGDPEPNEVTIWTKYEDDNLAPQEFVVWEVSDDANFQNIVQSGLYIAEPSTDYTVNIRLTGLHPYFNYWYRFSDGGGSYSVEGRTRTAPTGTQCEHIRMAITSCTSLYSGYFNGYARIAEREDLDAMIHLGDYLYDFVDPDEQIRIPSIYPQVPSNVDEWRSRHKQYLLDPDLRAARQMHPIIVIWDNHDLDWENGPDYGGGLQAFHEYVPLKLDDPAHPDKIWRNLHYGDLLDLIMTDAQIYQDQDIISGSDYCMWGNEQFSWIQDQLLQSNSTWRFVGQEKMMGGWSIVGFPAWFPISGSYIDEGEWDGHDVARDRFLSLLDVNNIDNVVVLSGDMHVSMSTDLALDPYGSGYDENTGDGSVAVEFLPASLSRGNLNEMLGSDFLADLVLPLSNSANPNHVYANIKDHGYGIIDVKQDSVVAEYWYCEIMSPDSGQDFAGGTVVKNGDNHWLRSITSVPTDDKVVPVNDLSALGELNDSGLKVYPNPSNSVVTIYSAEPVKRVRMYNTLGELVLEWEGNSSSVQVNPEGTGLFELEVETSAHNYNKRLIILD